MRFHASGRSHGSFFLISTKGGFALIHTNETGSPTMSEAIPNNKFDEKQRIQRLENQMDTAFFFSAFFQNKNIIISILCNFLVHYCDGFCLMTLLLDLRPFRLSLYISDAVDTRFSFNLNESLFL